MGNGARFSHRRSGHASLLAFAFGLLVAGEAHAGILFYDDFENGTGAWTFTGGWGTTTTGPHSVTRSLTDTPGYNYSANATATAKKTTPVSFANATRPRITFWLRYSSESLHDWLHVETSINGTGWITQNSFSGTQDTWRQTEVSLTGWAGQPTVYVRFRVESDAIIHGDGWYVDDLVIDDGNSPFTFSAPVASTVWPGSSNQDITWTYDGSYAPLATSMTVFYSFDDIIDWTLQSNLPMSTTSVPWPIPNEDSTARIRIELFDPWGSSLSVTTTPPFVVDSTAPAAFSPVSPADGACGSATPTFDWGNASDASAVRYTLTVTPSSGPALVESDLATSDHTLAQPDALDEANNPHAWTVTAVDAAGHTRTSATRSYQVDATPPASFDLTAPADGSTTSSAGLTFSWNTTTDTGCGLSHYTLLIDGDVCADNLPTSTDSIALAATSCASLASGAHTWTVVAVDTAGNSGFSSASPGGNGGWQFTVPGEPEPDPDPDPGSAGHGGEAGEPGTAGTTSAGRGGSTAAAGTAGEEPGSAGEASGGEGSGTGGTGTGGVNGVSGRGASGGATSAGGNAGAMTVPGAGRSAGSPVAGSNDDGGCGCRVAPRSKQSHLAALAMLTAALVLGRRTLRHPSRRSALPRRPR